MSRAFTSEEYESAQDIRIEIPEKKTSPDAQLVFDYSKGRNYNDPLLPFEIGIHFLNGDEGFFQSDELALKLLERAVEMNCTQAMLALADFYLKDNKTQGYRKAAALVKKAADLEDEDAATRLDMTKAGTPSSRKTYETYRLNAELGDTEAMLLLAENLEKGTWGKDKYKSAAFWYTRAFKAGIADASKKVLALYYKKKIDLSDEELRFLRS